MQSRGQRVQVVPTLRCVFQHCQEVRGDGGEAEACAADGAGHGGEGVDVAAAGEVPARFAATRGSAFPSPSTTPLFSLFPLRFIRLFRISSFGFRIRVPPAPGPTPNTPNKQIFNIAHLKS